MKRSEKIEIIDSLLNGDHNLKEEQRDFLMKIKKEVLKAKTYGDLKIIGVELLKFIAQLYIES